MIPSKELHELPLPDGGRITTDESNGLGIRVTRLSADSSVQAAVQLDFPPAGFGGGGWVLSPSGDLLVLHYYSGQSEETFVLLNLSNRGLAVIAHPEYQYGEYASYAFSPTEDSMIMALPRTCGEWWSCWEDDGLETADDGAAVCHFATLLRCSTDSGLIHKTRLELLPSVASPLGKDEYDPDLTPRIFANCDLSIQLPWASARLNLADGPERVRIPYPPKSVG